MNVPRMGLVALLSIALGFSTVSASTDGAFGLSSSSKGMLPEWLTIHKDKEKLSSFMALARQRHAEAVQKARDEYFHGGASEAGADALESLEFEERQIRGPGKIPDFSDELDRTCFVTKSSTPLFTKEECQDMIGKAEEHFANEGGEWTRLPSGQYDVAGFWIKSIPACHQWFNRMVQERLFPLLVQKFPHFCPEMEDLVVDNAYVFKYTPETGRRTDVHTDSGCLSFTIALNGFDEYSGGGTWFEGLDSNSGEDSTTGGSTSEASMVIEMDVGQCTVRPGGVRHCGHAVSSGTRYIIGGFCMNVKKVEYVRMLMLLGSEEGQKGNYEKAEGALEAAIALNPDFYSPYSHLADVLTKQGKVGKAQKVLEHCFEHVNGQSGEIAYSLGTMYFDQENYEKTIKCMNACLEADDTDVDAMLVMAQICTRQQDNAGEEAWYQRIIATPGAAKDVAGKAYCNLGVLNTGTEKEIEYYEKSLELSPDSFPALYSLGCAQATKENWDTAVDNFRKAIEVSEENSEEQKQTLQNLYRATMGKLQADNPAGASSREEMMRIFMDVMGEENYKKLAAMRPQ